MGDDDHRHSLGCQILEHGQHLADEFGVQRTGGLVEEHEIGLHRHGASDGHPLLLPAGQLGGVVVGTSSHAHPLQQVQGSGPGLVLAGPGNVDRGLHDVLQGRHVRKEVESLEDHADPGPLGSNRLLREPAQPSPSGGGLLVSHQLTVDADAAGLEGLQLVDAPQQRRLSRSGRAEQDAHLTLADVQVHPLENVQGAEFLVQGLDMDHGRLVGAGVRRCRVLGEWSGLGRGVGCLFVTWGGSGAHSSTSGSGSAGVVPDALTAD